MTSVEVLLSRLGKARQGKIALAHGIMVWVGVYPSYRRRPTRRAGPSCNVANGPAHHSKRPQQTGQKHPTTKGGSQAPIQESEVSKKHGCGASYTQPPLDVIHASINRCGKSNREGGRTVLVCGQPPPRRASSTHRHVRKISVSVRPTTHRHHSPPSHLHDCTPTTCYTSSRDT